MDLVSKRDLIEGAGLKKMGFLGGIIGSGLMAALNINRLNELHAKVENLYGEEFLESLLREMNIDFQLHEEDLKRIPTSGPFLLVCNHPLGGLDGILLLHIITKVRPDFKIIANFLLHRINGLHDYVFPVNPFETRKEMRSSTKGLLDAYRYLNQGHPVGIFPAGEVSMKNDQGQIVDRPWPSSAVKFIQKAKVPIVPFYFHAKNSELFYRLSKLHPDLQTALLPTEFLRRREKPVKVRIGKVITPKDQEQFTDSKEFGAYIRRKVYVLASFYEGNKAQLLNFKFPKAPSYKAKTEQIIAETPVELMEKEVEKLRQKEGSLLFTHANYECFFSDYQSILNVFREISRLREITFRAIGEGTLRSSDTDHYDGFYHHLFLWDKKAKRIVGAYRMGMGQQIYEKHGIQGFYLNELFNFEPEIHPFFKKCIEMGRAFVVKDYQQKPLPLFLLWRGIVHICLRNTDHKYIIGGVSISNQFSDFSKSLMIEFMTSHYYDPFVAQFVKPKKEFKVRLKDAEKEFILDSSQSDLNKFDKVIDELEPNALRLPVLLKKYIKQNAKVIGFNVDPKFNDAVDGLMYIRISDIPEATVRPVMEELQKGLEEKGNQKAEK